MTLAPTLPELLARARGDLRLGLPVVVTEATGGVLMAATETLGAGRLAAMRALGPVWIGLTARRAQTLKARAYDGDLARVSLPDDGGLDWLRALADPATDLATPMKGPFHEARDGGPVAAFRLGLAMAKSARLLPSVVGVELPDAAGFAAAHHLCLIPSDFAAPLLDERSPLHPIVAARVPVAAAEAGRLHVFRPEDGGEEHYAFEIGRPDRDTPVLARLHSACFTGDVMGSLKCDCGPQLHAALEHMGQEGAGVLLYLNQEGRGIGLANKMRAYSLQDQGFDTVEANHRLGFEDDERDFRLGADILRRLGFGAVRLMTNNPAKIDMMQRNGIAVSERVPLKVGETAQNRAYLATKAAKSGHML
ncbi:MAG: GTP cyclohydrolase II [Rhodobacteraceae bacterium]|nr:GTP cyclohydrolase II [Paracoccaceae bacterium]